MNPLNKVISFSSSIPITATREDALPLDIAVKELDQLLNYLPEEKKQPIFNEIDTFDTKDIDTVITIAETHSYGDVFF